MGQKKRFTATGRVRFFQRDVDTFVEANTSDVTASAEMVIATEPLVSLRATEFFL